MKHILNNLSEQEKNSIREQHTGGMKVMTESFSRLLNSKLGDAKPFVNEQAETKVAGPIGAAPLQYYIYSKGGKFYIYQTNATQKTPILMQGTTWSNNGQGYGTQDEAEKVIQQQLSNKPSYSDEDVPRESPVEMNEQPTKMKTGESLNDDELLEMACTTWSRYTSEDKQKALNWSKNFTKGSPFNPIIACKSKSVDVIGSDNDRTVLKGIIELNWM
jgi:hypothetical protein